VSADPHDLQPTALPPPEVFISYARRDYDKVRRIADQLAALGVDFWLDQQAIEGGTNYALAIVRGIKLSRVVILMCSDAALRSRNVNQEIMLAWRYARPYLPLLLEPLSFPEQVEYFLEGCQWIEVLDRPAAEWLPRVQRALTFAGVVCDKSRQPSAPTDAQTTATEVSTVRPAQNRADLIGLRSFASFNDRIWPIAADSIPRDRHRRATFRGLGAPQEGVQHGYKIGSHMEIAIQAERAGHLLVIDEGPEGIVYCLCPSWFAPDTRINEGVSYLPRAGGRYESFQVSGEPGREQLIAIITDEPLAFDWMPPDPRPPARVLDAQDIELLLSQLRLLDPASWVAYATYFDVVR
jgi:TIR domain/Domain of unknown function (DUF4384)